MPSDIPLSTPWELAQKQTITAYNDRRLNMDILDAILGVFEGYEMNVEDSQMFFTYDDKIVEQIVVELINPDFTPDLGENGWGWEDEFAQIAKLRWNWI